MSANHLGHSNPHKEAQWKAEYQRLQHTAQRRKLEKAVAGARSAFVEIIPNVQRFADGLNRVGRALRPLGNFTRITRKETGA